MFNSINYNYIFQILSMNQDLEITLKASTFYFAHFFIVEYYKKKSIPIYILITSSHSRSNSTYNTLFPKMNNEKDQFRPFGQVVWRMANQRYRPSSNLTRRSSFFRCLMDFPFYLLNHAKLFIHKLYKFGIYKCY